MLGSLSGRHADRPLTISSVEWIADAETRPERRRADSPFAAMTHQSSARIADFSMPALAIGWRERDHSPMETFVVVFAVVFALNTLPAFAPPTWMVMSLVGLNNPQVDPLSLASIAALAATGGRLTLARLSRVLIRNKLMGEPSRENIDVLSRTLEGRRKMTAGAMLFYAFTPLPTNYLFIAYGLAGMSLWLIALPFFVGRFVSYAAWTYLAQSASQTLDLESAGAGSYLGGYFIVSQVFCLALVYAFTKINWRRLIVERKLGWIERNRRGPQDKC
jgi:membrane protein YqaA with SNARE-associated domain